jgi:transcriptional regulator with XRE-family HTH domain
MLLQCEDLSWYKSYQFTQPGPEMSKELGAFIRAHRERIAFEPAASAAAGRRRTPGLRREELAALCGASTTWISWLEQGRPVSASPRMLARLALALRLSGAQRAYLFRLAGKVDPEARIAGPDAAHATDMSRVVGAVGAPAYVLDREWKAVAWNDQAARLFPAWLGPDSPDGERNLLRFMFLQGEAKQLVTDWRERARRLVAEFRAECGKDMDAPPLKGLIATLQQQSADFLQFWNAQEVLVREGGTRTFMHPAAGRLVFEQATLQLQGRPDLKLTMLLPAAG